MRRAFGKPVGTAARVNRGQKVISVSVAQQHFPQAKESLRRAMMKLPSPCHVEVDRGEELTK
jgi:large subunit ribosomal protein L10e